MSSDKKRNYQVGRGKPPVHSRYPKGRSGNPSGRPKGKVTRIDADAVLNAVLSALVPVNDNGRPQKMSKLRVLYTQLVNRAIKGHHPSSSLVIGQVARQNARHETDEQPSAKSDAQSRKEFESFLKEMAENLGDNSRRKPLQDEGPKDLSEEKPNPPEAKGEPSSE
jgi:Family of unknown function (DUF5681)